MSSKLAGLVIVQALLPLILMSCGHPSVGITRSPYLTTPEPITLFSVNDGELATLFPVAGSIAAVDDSITRIRIYPDRPPDAITVYGTTSSTIYGSPYATIVGRYGIVSNHGERPGMSQTSPETAGGNEILAVDLESEDLAVVSRLELVDAPRLALAHPDGERLIVASTHDWLVLGVGEDGRLVERSRSPAGYPLSSFDIGRDGKTIIAAIEQDGKATSSKPGILRFELEDDDRIVFRGAVASGGFEVDGPFSPRISPDGTRALVLNGRGMPDGVLDDILVVDLRGAPRISQTIPQVADGLESLAFHPSGVFAVVACVNAHGPTVMGQLALVDLSGPKAQVLYHLPIERVPEGIEFTPNGRTLFVGATLANHIVVYDVDGRSLVRRPQVLPTGYGPSALAISGN